MSGAKNASGSSRARYFGSKFSLLAISSIDATLPDFHGETITPAEKAAILAAGPILQSNGKLTAGANLQQAGATLVNSSFTTELGLK